MLLRFYGTGVNQLARNLSDKMNLCFIFLLSTIPLTLAEINLHLLSDEFVSEINEKQSQWKAGRNFDKNTPWSTLRGRIGGTLVDEEREKHQRTVVHPEDDLVIPETFDAREQWPTCKSIQRIGDQGNCRSSWAMASTMTMSDRICIHSNGTKQTMISTQDLMTCCKSCGFEFHVDCNFGGYISSAWEYWNTTGIVSGGLYNTSDGCKAYSYQPCSHNNASKTLSPCVEMDVPVYPTCQNTCDVASLDYEKDRTFGYQPYGLPHNATQIQIEIMTNGPVTSGIDVFTDFFNYKSGVYQYVSGDWKDTQAVKILGWGVENGTPYWLAANSWNTEWGENGFFRILRGSDECGIEQSVMAALPQL